MCMGNDTMKKGNASQVQTDVISRIATRTVIVALVAAAAAAAYSLSLDNIYRAGSGLLFSPPPVNQPEARSRGVNPATEPASALSFLMAKPLGVPVYEQLLTNDDIAQKLRDRLVESLKQAGDNEGASAVTLGKVRKAMKVQTRIIGKTANAVEYDPVLVLNFTHTSPEIASALADEWARLGIELSEQFSRKGQEGTIDFLTDGLESVQRELDEKEKALEILKSQWDVVGMEARLAKTQELITTYEHSVITLGTDIARTEAELAQAKKDLEGVPEKLTLHKAPPDQAYWMLDATQGAPDSSKVLASEEVNWIHFTLHENAALLESTLAGLVKEREKTISQLEEMRAEVLSLQQNLAEQQRLQNALEREIDVYKDQYQRLAVNYEGARLAEAQNTPELKLAYEAAVPENKVGPHRSLIVIVAGFLGALVVPIRFLIVSTLRTYAASLDGQAASTV
mgnify:CR=1 FL=1